MKINYWDITDDDKKNVPIKDILAEQKSKYSYLISELEIDPFESREFLSKKTKKKIFRMLCHAFEQTQIYKKKFCSNNVTPDSFLQLSDLEKFPIIEKKEFIEADEADYIAKCYWDKKIYKTKTCGTTLGKSIDIYFDEQAIIKDTLQGVQQLSLQSKYKNLVLPSDITLHYYVHSWWTHTINDEWNSKFISSDTPPKLAAKKIKKIQPNVLAGYPSGIRQLMQELQPNELDLKLIITNSEFSTRAERDFISAHFGCPVLDEYSSEELTRIAIEMPDGHYYVNQDSVYLEVVDPNTKQLVEDGEWGEAVVTGLLNKAMPCIRYATGDWVKKAPLSDDQNEFGLNWIKLPGFGGRIADSLVRADGTRIPQNIILEKIDAKIFNNTPSILDFRIYQWGQEYIQIFIQQSTDSPTSENREFVNFIKELLSSHLGSSINIITETSNECLFLKDDEFTAQPQKANNGRKRRRIRFLGNNSKYLYAVRSRPYHNKRAQNY